MRQSFDSARTPPEAHIYRQRLFEHKRIILNCYVIAHGRCRCCAVVVLLNRTRAEVAVTVVKRRIAVAHLASTTKKRSRESVTIEQDNVL